MPLYSPPWCLRPPWKPAPSGEPPSRTFRTAVNSLSSRYDSNRACKFGSSLPSDCKVIQDISQFDRSLCVQIKYLAYGPISGGEAPWSQNDKSAGRRGGVWLAEQGLSA